jgi:hypothetical protein
VEREERRFDGCTDSLDLLLLVFSIVAYSPSSYRAYCYRIVSLVVSSSSSPVSAFFPILFHASSTLELVSNLASPQAALILEGQ